MRQREICGRRRNETKHSSHEIDTDTITARVLWGACAFQQPTRFLSLSYLSGILTASQGPAFRQLHVPSALRSGTKDTRSCQLRKGTNNQFTSSKRLSRAKASTRGCSRHGDAPNPRAFWLGRTRCIGGETVFDASHRFYTYISIF